MIFYKTKFMHLAFTLAEVLITLGIIGIVAAMTIPTLYGSLQKRQIVAKLQKAISVINQAYKLSYSENGDLTAKEVNDIGIDNYFNTYWRPYIKADICTTYTNCGYSQFPWTQLNGASYRIAVTGKNARVTFYTPDGMVFVLFAYTGTDAQQNKSITNMVIVDINGAKLPNTLGKDVFLLGRIQDEYGVEIVPQGNKQSDTKINANCSKKSSGNYCAEKIRRAGWKIDATYPW